ncbi:MAG TPA: hypothetical protein VN613_03540 [Gemmatimonadaceae bacterium]|nr:hypothetical protein [Gemmatimonadaceae bacterium]
MTTRTVTFRRLAVRLQMSRLFSSRTVERLLALAHVTPHHGRRALALNHRADCGAASGGDCTCDPEITLAGREN